MAAAIACHLYRSQSAMEWQGINLPIIRVEGNRNQYDGCKIGHDKCNMPSSPENKHLDFFYNARDAVRVSFNQEVNKGDD